MVSTFSCPKRPLSIPMSRRSPCSLSEALYCQLFYPCLQSTLRWLFLMVWDSSWSIFFRYGCSIASAPFIEKTLLCPIELIGHIYHKYEDPLLDSVPLIYINVSIWCQCHVVLIIATINYCFGLLYVACKFIVPLPGIESMPLMAEEVWCPKHWTPEKSLLLILSLKSW